jgi:septal ring factor EnvC (AmiA/AmiB activator)
VLSSADDPTPGQIQRQIDRKQSLIGGHKKHERVLTSDIAQYTDRIHSLENDIGKLSARQHKLQTSLDSKREELAAVQAKLRSERARLARLKGERGAGKAPEAIEGGGVAAATDATAATQAAQPTEGEQK